MMCPITGRPAQILLVEDNPGDVRLAQEALMDGRICNNLHVVGSGDEALAYLRGEGQYAERPRPDLILLDLNLPGRDGREVLAEIKGDPALRSIPVVILTTSEEEEDVLKAYHLNANCYITKPVSFDQFLRVIQAVQDFWFTIVKLPSG